MDYLMTPHDALADEDTVPYVAKERYDGGPFLTYPLRTNPPRPILLEDQGKYRPDKVSAFSSEELNSFMQTWLFFGLLNEIFGNEFNYDDFVFPSVDGSFVVKGSHIINLFQQWLQTNKAEATEQSQERSAHLHDCADLAISILHFAARHESGFSRSIRSSIIFLYDLFLNIMLMNKLLPPRMRRYKSDPRLYVLDDLVRADMVRNGWCPSQVWQPFKQATEFQLPALWYYGKIRITDEIGKHTDCTATKCKRNQIDTATYRPLHRSSDCLCDDAAINRSQIDEILEAGSYPILRLTRKNDDEIAVDILPASSRKRYIAISHVWSQGMGNPLANTLPQCQLNHLLNSATRLITSRMYGFAARSDALDRGKDQRRRSWEYLDRTQIAEEKNANHGRRNSFHFSPSLATSKMPEIPSNSDREQDLTPWNEVLLWIDTICCPIGPPAMKRLSLSKMKEVYQKATDVLVLDSNLQRHSTTALDIFEIFFRVASSAWGTRLWTVQEAFLTKRLWFQFADQAFPLRHIYAHILQHIHDIRVRSLVLHIHGAISRIVPGSGNLKGIGKVAAAVTNREVSVASDEPLCLATLLGSDPSAVIHSAHSDGMIEIWDIVSRQEQGISSMVIFHAADRLDQHGYKWAPRSLLDKGTRFKSALDNECHKGKGIVTPKGLRVMFPGLNVSLGTLFCGIVDTKVRHVFSRDPIKKKWYVLGPGAMEAKVAQHLGLPRAVDYELPPLEKVIKASDQRLAMVLATRFQTKDEHVGLFGILSNQVLHSHQRTIIQYCGDEISDYFELAYQLLEAIVASGLQIDLSKYSDAERVLSNESFHNGFMPILREALRILHQWIKDGVIQRQQNTDEQRLLKSVTIIATLGYLTISEDYTEDTVWYID